MEKSKCTLPRLKKVCITKKKQEQSRSSNNQFRADPSRVYSTLSKESKHDKNNGRPVYKNKENAQQEKQLFDDVDEGTGFWKRIIGAKGYRRPTNEIANGNQKCHTQARKTMN